MGVDNGVMDMQLAEERFFIKVEQADECWEWTGAKNPYGYGNFGFDGRTWKAHRWAYEFLRAPIPDGLCLDHLCRNRACVNPWHLEPVTQGENVRRIPAELQTPPSERCPRGHLLDAANTYVAPRPYSGRRRRSRCCKTCLRATQARFKAKHIIDGTNK